MIDFKIIEKIFQQHKAERLEINIKMRMNHDW